MNDSRGTIWRKWDLHLHTPASYDYADKSVTADAIVAELKKANISAVAITDHHRIDVEFILKLQELAGEDIIVFPGIELRSELGGSESVHFVGLFPAPASKEELDHIWTILSGSCGLTEVTVAKTGDENIYCDFKDTAEIIHSLGGLVSVHAGTKSNTIENITSRFEKFKDHLRTDLVTDSVDILEISKSENIPAYEEKVFPSIGFRLPMICCSDNHNISDYENSRFTWIKADPTFDGLKQIKYEPEIRVKIQESNPEQECKKSFFSKLVINAGQIFDKDKPAFAGNGIPINRDLVAIIGGRGTGKSLLLDCVRRVFNKTLPSADSPRFTKVSRDLPFTVIYEKEDGSSTEYGLPEDNNLDYLHVQQGEVKGIVEAPSQLDTEIKKLIGIVDTSAHTLEQDEATVKTIQGIANAYDFLEKREEAGSLVNDVGKLEKELSQYEDYISTITTEQNKGKILAYRQNNACLDFLKSRKDKLDKLKASLSEFQDELNDQIDEVNVLYLEVKRSAPLASFVDSNKEVFELRDIGEDLDQRQCVLAIKRGFTEQHRKDIVGILGSDSEADVDDLFVKAQFLKLTIAPLDFSEHEAQADEMKKADSVLIQKLQEKNKSISKDFLKENINEDVSTLLSKVVQYQTSIGQIRQRIKAIKTKKDQLSHGYETLFGVADKIESEWKSQEEDVKEKWRQLKSVEDKEPSPARQLIDKLLDDIEINAQIEFVKESFYQRIQTHLDMKKFKSKKDMSSLKRLEDVMGVKDAGTFLRLLRNDKIISIDNEQKISLREFLKEEDYFVSKGQRGLLRALFLWEHIDKYSRVISKSTYKGKEPFELSVGQRGTFYVCLKLATDTFGLPFVFDQPEDDLDNDFMANELVEMFRAIKKYRQVIIVTHNANLCVNADAEQVIVALNDSEVISYTNGSLENPEIRKSVYTILEGGQEAFMKRERKYDF
ncbi:TrlF family AAA-like ATPase [Planctomycetota bacterium]